MQPVRLLPRFALAALLVGAGGLTARAADPLYTPYGVFAPASGYHRLPGLYSPYYGVFTPNGYVSPFIYGPSAYSPFGSAAPLGFVAPGGAYAPYGYMAPFGLVAPYGFVAPVVPPAPPPPSKPAKITITLPTDAALSFNGQAAQGEGGVRAFQTPDLVPGYPYVYELTASVVRGRQTVHTTERVVVWGGEEAKVTLQLPPAPPVPKPKQ